MDTEAELRSLERVLTEILGRPSRWSGRVEFTNDPQVFGIKPFVCDIIINEGLLGRSNRTNDFRAYLDVFAPNNVILKTR